LSSAQGFEPYTRCPAYRFIARPSSMDYVISSGGGPDWDHPVRVSCMCCHHSYVIGRGDVLPLTAGQPCPRCPAVVTACAAGAARVRCAGCGVYLAGSGLDAAERERLAVSEGQAAVALRERYVAALRRAGRRP
jgi:hypothetical protein